MLALKTQLNFGSHKKLYTLIDKNGKPYKSSQPGTLGGYKPKKIYGRLDCSNALNWIKKGHYAEHRVFFKDEATAIQSGYRPCGRCLKPEYEEWKKDPVAFKKRKLSVLA